MGGCPVVCLFVGLVLLESVAFFSLFFFVFFSMCVRSRHRTHAVVMSEGEAASLVHAPAPFLFYFGSIKYRSRGGGGVTAGLGLFGIEVVGLCLCTFSESIAEGIDSIAVVGWSLAGKGRLFRFQRRSGSDF